MFIRGPFLSAALLAALRVVRSAPTVTILNGTLTGAQDTQSKVDKYLGIPYAEPPIGELRLRQAIPLQKSFGTRETTSFGHACYGAGNQPNASEDCLTLNIWRPSSAAGDNGSLPVLVWFYGGGFISGYTSNPLYDGTNMVKISQEIGKPIIMVSVNYRLGPFGFLNGKQMTELGLLNIGLLDERLALHWVQENIAAFGGDPTKVTLFGESAGAVSGYSHLVAYGGRDDHIFRGVILQSGGAFPLTYPNTTAFQSTYDSLISKSTCSSTTANASASQQLDCIRKLSVNDFRSKVGTSTGQSVDGGITPTSIQFALPAGKYVKVAVMVGANTDEGTASAPSGVNSNDQLLSKIEQGYFRPVPLPEDMAQKLLSLYPSDPSKGCPYNSSAATAGNLNKQACAIFGDLVQIGPARMIARAVTAHNGNVPVYRYRFNQLAHNAPAARGISTGSEIPFMFSNQLADWPADKTLAHDMTSAWISFAYDLNPNAGGNSTLPFWPVYGTNASSIVFTGSGSTIETDTYRAEGIDYIIENVLPYGAA